MISGCFFFGGIILVVGFFFFGCLEVLCFILFFGGGLWLDFDVGV